MRPCGSGPWVWPRGKRVSAKWPRSTTPTSKRASEGWLVDCRSGGCEICRCSTIFLHTHTHIHMYMHTDAYVYRCTLVWMQAFDFIIALQSQIIIKLNAAWNFAMSLLLLLLLVASMALQFFRSFAHWLIRFAFLVWRMSKQKLWKKGKKAIRKVFWDFSKAGRNPT